MKEVYSPFKKKTASKILSLLGEWRLIKEGKNERDRDSHLSSTLLELLL